MLDEKDKERVLQATNLADLIGRTTPLKKTQSGRSWFCCPFHKEKTPSFTVHLARQTYHCFGCGAHGNAITFLREHEGMGFMDAVKQLADDAHITLHFKEETDAEKQQREQQDALRSSIKIATKMAHKYFVECYNSKEGYAARQYAMSRWNDEKFLSEYQVGFAPNNWHGFLDYAEKNSLSKEVLEAARLITKSPKTGKYHDFFVNRFIIPIRNHFGEVIGFSARTMEPATLEDGTKNPNAEPKYINTANNLIYDKDHTLFGLERAWRLAQKEGNCYCVEGGPDVIRLHLLKYDNTVACLGADWTENQLKLLQRYTNTLTFIPDSDIPKPGEKLGVGFKKVIRAGQMAYRMGFAVFVKEIPTKPEEKQDADSFFDSRTKFREVPVHDFLPWYALQLIHEGKTESQAMQEVVQTLVYCDSELELKSAIDQLKQAFGTKTLWRTALQEAKAAKAKQEADARASKETVSLELMKQYGFHQHEGHYYFSLSEDHFYKWSNFVMKPLFHVRDANSQALRLFEMTNEFNQSQIVELKQEDLISLSRFKLKVESLGNYVWLAKDEQLTRLKQYLYKETLTADLITQLGWQPNAGFFAWGNGAFYNGVWYEADTFGIVHLPVNQTEGSPSQQENNFYFPAFSSVYTRDKGLFNFERRFIYHPMQTITLRQYSEKITNVFGDNGMEGLAFLIATLFRDVITRETKSFPILNIFGPKGSGKSELGHSLMAFFVAGNTPPNIQNSTIPALSDSVAQCANALVHIDEFKDTVDADKREFLKGLWDGVGRNRMNMEKDKKREQTRVDSGIILTGQEMATADIALFSRFIFLSFGITEFSTKAKQAFQDLADTRQLGVSHLTHQILKHRAFFEANFRAAYDTACDDLFSALKNDGVEDRIIRNWIIPLAAFGTLQSKLDFPFNYEQLKQFSISGVRSQQTECSSNNEVSTFWSALSSMRETGEFFEGSVYRIDSLSKLKTRDKGQLDWGCPRLVLRLRVKVTLGAYSRYIRSTGIKGLVQNSLLFYLQNDKRCYLGLQHSCRFENRVGGLLQTNVEGSKVTAKTITDEALCFDYEAVKKTYNVFFTDDGSDDDPIPESDELTPEPMQLNLPYKDDD